MYAQDFDETFPPNYFHTGLPSSTSPGAIQYPGGSPNSQMIWPMPVYPYVNNIQVFNCPSWSYRWSGNYTGRQAYGINRDLPTGNNGRSAAMAEITMPADTILITDNFDEGDSQTYYTRRRVSVHSTSGRIRNIIPDRHNGGANYGFCDGHAKWIQVPYESNYARAKAGETVNQDFPGLRWN